MSKAAYYVWMSVLVLLVVIGLYGFYSQTVEGHHLTGASKWVPWGLYIPSGAFFVGASAGASIVGLMVYGFGRDDYAPIATRAILIGLVSLMAGMLFVIADVGIPQRMLLIPWILRNITSPFIYSSMSYYLFGLLLLADLFYSVKITRGTASGTDKKTAKWLAIITFLFAVWVLAAVSGVVFSSVKTREFWSSPLVPPHFVISALVTGIAIIIIGTILSSKTTRRELVSKETLSHMGKLLTLFIAVNVFFDVYDLLLLTYGATPGGIEAWGLLTGRYAPSFGLHIGGLFVALIILLFKQGRTTKGLSVASTLALAGVAAYRYNLVVIGQLVPLLPGLPEISYFPTWIEISVVTGIVALAILLYNVLTTVIPMEKIRSS